MQKILITGANGQLGNEFRLISEYENSYKFIFTDVAELDICSKQAIEVFFEAEKPDFVINCAAYTAVDKAEAEEEKAFAINCKAVENLAQITFENNIRFIHISTDYVFGGTAYLPYSENAPTEPNSAYGKSKLAGEIAAMNKNSETVIIRTSWLYSAFGNNFLKTIRKAASVRTQLNVVFDQIGTPTYANHLAIAIMQIISKIECDNEKSFSGIYHFSNEGVCSWYDFAIEIVKLAKLNCQILPIETIEYPTPAKRPPYSLLNKNKIKATFCISIPYWREGVAQCINKLDEMDL